MRETIREIDFWKLCFYDWIDKQYVLLLCFKIMNYKLEDFEIMAPVGSRESLAAAIQAGANSIYLG